MASQGSEKPFKISDSSALYEFVKAFAKSAVTNLEKLDGTSDMGKYYQAGASGAAGIVAFAFPAVAPFRRLIQSVFKAGIDLVDKIQQDKKKLTVKSVTDSTSSAAFPRDFLRLFVGLGLCVYHSHSAYFEYINLKINSTSNESKLLVIQMLGEYAGAIYFSQMHENGRKKEDDFTKLKEKSILRWLSSKWTSVVVVELYFLFQKKTGGKQKQKTITPYAFFVEEFFKSPKYDWNFGRSNTGGKKYTLLKTNNNKGKSALDFSYDFQEEDLNGVAESICNQISNDSTFSWKDTVLVKVEGTYVLVDSVDRKVSNLIDIATEHTDKLQKFGENQKQQTATLNEVREDVKQLKLENKPVDPQPKIERFRVENPIRTFIGREAFLEKLVRAVREGQGQGEGGIEDPPQENITVVTATGGVGKTETVRRYIQKHGHEYDHIVWIDAEDISSAQSQFTQLALALSISLDFDGKPKPFDQIFREIFETKLLPGARVVLLVLDNADALDDDSDRNLKGIRLLLPKSLPLNCVEPTVIVTSRTQNWSVGSVIPLDLWSHDEVVLFVHRHLPLHTDEKALQQLGTRFGFLPVAIKSAVAVICQQNKRGDKKFGILDLLKEYDEKDSERRENVLAQKHLKAGVGPEQTTLTMLLLWNISLEKIVRFKDGELAVKILCCMAYMSPTRIPVGFLLAVCKNSCSQDSVENALEILQDYSLITSLSSDDSAFNSFSIHRMIQDSTIKNLRTRTNEGHTPHTIFSENTFINENEVLLKLSAESLNYLRTFTTLTFPRRMELVETLIQITNHVSGKLDVQEFRDLTTGVAEALRDTNNLTKSIELFEKVLEATPAPCNGIEIWNKIELQDMLAKAYGKQGHAQKSLDLFLQVVEVMIDSLGPHHEVTLIEKCQVAVVLKSLKRYDEGIEMFQKVLQGYTNNGDTQSEDYLDAKTQYAAILFAKGEKKVASKLLTQVLKEQQKDSKSNYENIVRTNAEIAFQLDHEGKLEEALNMRLQNLEGAVKLLGPFDLTTLDCKKFYASALSRLGKHDEAASLLMELLETYETQLGLDHPVTVSTKFSLSSVYLATKELDKAEALLDVEVMERVFGPEHLWTLKAVNVLSLVKEEQEKFEDALALSKKVLEVHKKVLGPNHEDTMRTMHTIGKLYAKMEEYEKAAPLLRELLETKETQLGPDHRSTLETKLVLAVVYLKTKELDKAEALLDVELMENVFGRDHPATMEAATMLSLVKEEKDKFREALALSQKVLKVRKNVLGPYHEDTLSTMHIISKLYYEMDEYEKAAEVLQEVLEREEEVLGKDHPDAIITSRFLTSCRQRIDNQNKFTSAFITLTSVDAETGKSFLEASNWNLKAALEAYRNSNPNALIEDQDHESTPSSGTSTAAENQNNAIVKFMALTGVDAKTGKLFLQALDWNLEDALVSFFHCTYYEDYLDSESQDDAVIPTAAATDSENLHLATASYNETVVNPIQDLGVQVESVEKPNRTTTSILFRFPGGGRLQGKFGVSSTVRDLHKFVNEKRPDLADSNYVLTLYPNTKLTEMEETLEEANVLNNVALTIKILKK